MTQHPRLLLPQATYFFTVRLEKPGATLLTDHIESLRYAYARAVQDYPVTCHAMVVLPDHLHAIWTEPSGGIWYAERWRRIKTLFANAIPSSNPTGPYQTGSFKTGSYQTGPYQTGHPPDPKRRPGIWQRRFQEHALRTEAEVHRAMAYCQHNPVKHGLTRDAALWPFSSFAKRRTIQATPGARHPALPREEHRMSA